MEHKKSMLGSLIAKHAFDFFSLFLAITLGFFVDNLRDSMQSKSTASEVSSNLLSDLFLDTASIDNMILHAANKEKLLTKLYVLVQEKEQSKNDSLIYRYTATVNHRPWFDRHNSSYQLCLNTGYLQYFSQPVIAGLTEYNIECDKVIDLLSHEKLLLNSKIFPFLQKIFHTENFASILQDRPLTEPTEMHDWSAENRWLFHNYIYELIEVNKEISAQYKKLYSKSRATIWILRAG